ncbi:MAG: SMC-Scp complex subunit ScpB [Gemmataceae bacterium]|nr:SMC-Scp complex subunit ScpB [Gemmataceae bacterium]
MPSPDETTPDATPPEDLGRSYEAILHQQWSVDVPEVAPELQAEDVAPAAPERAAELHPSAHQTAPPAEDTPPAPVRIVEALLFTGGAPLTATQACEVIRGLTPEQFQQALDTLNQDYRRQGRPYAIQPQGQGHVLTLRPRYRKVIDRLHGGTREARLSPAAIDVLALVAYRQPATRQEVDSLRGAESGALLRQLVRRGLLTVVQRGDAAQREVAYGTTPRFLELFGLSSLEDLPQTQELQQL